ncbi:MAG: T9SS type A sorting domain-containing protein [Bacteroidales bacterium]|nr:T9SS type A sorting domain-containing protein [Bacteroidales bacterium]
MRKLLNRMLRMVPLLALVFSFAQTSAQRPYGPLAETDFQFTMTNIVQPAGTNNIIEFDLYILDTDPSQVLPMATAQFGINFNLGILNGAATTTGMTVALPYSEGFSDLPSSMAPNGASTLASGLIRIAGRAAPGCLDGFPISNAAPGTRANRFRFTSSAPFAPNSTPNFVFTASTATNPSYATRFAWYNPACTNVQLPVVPGVNAIVDGNPVLNPQVTCVDPTVFTVTGGGSYCEGGVGVPVGLDGSQVGVNYAIVPGTLVVPGDGNPITFGNQLAGSYTVVATSDGTNPAICTDPVNMTGGADVTATPVSTVEFTESACDTYTWALNGETYTVSGDYTYVVGCVTNILHLTITPSSTMEHTESACDSYTWALNGMTYTTSGDYTYVDGCVTHILHLTITPGSTIEFTEAACDSYTWAVSGMTYNTSGDYTYVVGCVTNILHLTITPSGNNEYTVSACDSYTWAVSGLTYTVSGDYTFVNGCSSNVLHLTITPSTTNEIAISACDSFTWLNGVTYTESGDYTYVDPEFECHTNILHLTITPSSTVEFTESACASYTWALNGVTYSESGVYTYVVGCVTNVLNLTITPLPDAAGAISGLAIVTEGDAGIAYSVGTIANADSYVWAYSGTGVTINGSGAAVTLDFAVGATSGSLFVYGANSCGNGDYSFLSITVEPAGTTCTATIWTGVEDGNWFNPANWNPCVPTSETAVTIPGGVPNFPTLYFNASCASILIQDGGSFIGAERLDVAQAEVQRYFANSDFHFLSSPVTSINFGTVFPLNQDAVWAREYNESLGDWVNLFIADYMEVGKGYSIQMTEPQLATFPGIFNSTNVTKPLSYANTGGDPNRVGWNLLGNPFQSALSWNIILNAGGPIPIVEASAYVWNGVQYVSWNGFTGSLTGGIIPPQNGFFVKAIAPGFSFNIPLAARVHSNIPFYKENLANLLQLRSEGNGYNDETFIRFNEEATPLFDGNHDAYKLWGLENAPQLYSIIPNEVLSINELPFEGNEVVNLGFKCGVAGTYSLNASGVESFNSSTPILLEDLKLNILQDLRLNPVYSFNYATNDSEARFKLHFKAATGIADPANSGIFVYSYEHTVVINNTTNLNGEIRIFDMTGRELKDANMSAASETRLPLQVAVGTYIVKVTTALGTVNQKVFVK